MFTAVYLGLKCKDKRMRRHYNSNNSKFVCAKANVSQRQFQVIHWSDMAEALTADLVETSLENMRQAITISDWHSLSSLKIPCGPLQKSFLLSAFIPDTIMMAEGSHRIHADMTTENSKGLQRLNILCWQICAEKKMPRS